MKKDKGITLIVLVITIIVLLILAGVSISALSGENGILKQAARARNLSEISQEEEYIRLIMFEDNLKEERVGQKLEEVKFDTLEDTVSIYDSETGEIYADGWYYIKPEDVNEYNLKNSYITNYDKGEFLMFDENKHRIISNELLCIKEGLVYSADSKNMSDSDKWGDAILYNFKDGGPNSGWSEDGLMFDGIDDGIEIKNNSDYSGGITLEIYFKLKGKGSSDVAQILMMKRNQINNGFFMFLDSSSTSFGKLLIDIGGSSNRYDTRLIVKEGVPIYITYTYDPEAGNEKGILYVNGEKHSTTDKGNIDKLMDVSENTGIQIGSDIYQSYGEDSAHDRKYSFFGDIYTSRVYNRPLTEEEVKYNYNVSK